MLYAHITMAEHTGTFCADKKPRSAETITFEDFRSKKWHISDDLRLCPTCAANAVLFNFYGPQNTPGHSPTPRKKRRK